MIVVLGWVGIIGCVRCRRKKTKIRINYNDPAEAEIIVI